MQRVGQPIEIAKPASYITGSTLVIDGGITLFNSNKKALFARVLLCLKGDNQASCLPA
ncbi:hypothetical protein [Oenococcus sp.]|uniref:hypothetical protein n=1 Tax=Oenococcus sp. TaxID=1979414 RepID=UPI0039EBA1C7